MIPDSELHDEIMKEFRKYFELNQLWAVNQSHRSAIRVRNSLKKIRKLCSEQRKLIQEWRYDNFAPMKASKAGLKRIEARKNQNSSNEGLSDDN